jgi:hypothetical protein
LVASSPAEEMKLGILFLFLVLIVAIDGQGLLGIVWVWIIKVCFSLINFEFYLKIF